MIISKRFLRGFSLIEILISLVIIGIVILFSIQVFSDYFTHRKQYLYMQQLYHDLKFSRVEAIVLDVPVVIQAYNSEQNSVSTNWCDGWVIYRNSNQQAVPQAAQIVKIHAGMKNCDIVFSGSLAFPYFQFFPNGSSDYQNGSFSFYDQSKVTMKIIINQVGRVRWETF